MLALHASKINQQQFHFTAGLNTPGDRDWAKIFDDMGLVLCATNISSIDRIKNNTELNAAGTAVLQMPCLAALCKLVEWCPHSLYCSFGWSTVPNKCFTRPSRPLDIDIAHPLIFSHEKESLVTLSLPAYAPSVFQFESCINFVPWRETVLRDILLRVTGYRISNCSEISLTEIDEPF